MQLWQLIRADNWTDFDGDMCFVKSTPPQHFFQSAWQVLLLILGERSVFTTFAKPFFSPWLPYRISSLWRFVLLPSDHIYHILCASILVSGKWTASRSSYPFSNLIWVNFFLYASHLVTKAGWWKFSYAFTTAFIAAAFSVSLIYMHENCSFVAVGRKAVWRIYCLCNLHSKSNRQLWPSNRGLSTVSFALWGPYQRPFSNWYKCAILYTMSC